VALAVTVTGAVDTAPPRALLILEVNLQWVHLHAESTPEAVVWLDGFLAFNVPVHTGGKPRFRRVPLLERVNRRFRGGLLQIVQAGAQEAGIAVQVRDLRTPPVLAEVGDPVPWLRPEQKEALWSGLANARGVLKLATGAGKGEIVAAFPMSRRCPWLILVHRTHLLADLADRFEKRSEEQAGRIGEGEWTQRRVTFATYATLYAAIQSGDPRAERLFSCVRGVICDETHVVAAETFSAVVERCVRAYWWIGVSATPFSRTDQRSILVAAHLGPILFDLDAGDLIEMGRLARPTIRMVEVKHPHHLNALPWREAYAACLTENAARNALAVRAVERLPKPAIVFVQELAHGQRLLALLQAAGLRTIIPPAGRRGALPGFAHGGLDLDDRKRVIAALNARAVDVVVATAVFNEGVDVTGLATVVNAAGGESSIATLQRIGRATRKTATKTTCEVVDFLDLGVLSLERHAKARRRAYIREGYDVSVQAAPNFDPTLPLLSR